MVGELRVDDAPAGFVVVVVVGAFDTGAVDGAAFGLLLLHAPSASTAAANSAVRAPRGGLRIEARLRRTRAYDRAP